jgi:hypothetical protein
VRRIEPGHPETVVEKETSKLRVKGLYPAHSSEECIIALVIIEIELELVLSQMAQKPVLRMRSGVRV